MVQPDGSPGELVLLPVHPTDRSSEAASACVLERVAAARFPVADVGRVGVVRVDDEGRAHRSWTVRPFPRTSRPGDASRAVLVGVRSLGAPPEGNVAEVVGALETDDLDACRQEDDDVNRVVTVVVDGVVRGDRFARTGLVVLDEVVGRDGRLRPRVDPARFPVDRGCVRRVLSRLRVPRDTAEGARLRVRWAYGSPSRLASDGMHATDRLVHVPPSDDAVELEAVDRKLRGRLPAMRACWADGLRREKRPLQGGAIVSFRIDPTGFVSSPTVPESDLASPIVATCLAELVGAMRFERPRKSRRVTYPLWFGPSP